MQRTVNGWVRAASVAGAAVLVWSAWKGYQGRRRDDTRRALGGTRGTLIRERIAIRAPIETLFSFWRNPSNLPLVIPFLQRVDRLDSARSHWTMAGPAGMPLEWDAEIINIVPFETIGWQSLPGSDVASAGSVHFRESLDGVTEVTVTMQYAPLAGKLGAAAAGLFGSDAAARVREALHEFKFAMESDPLRVARSQSQSVVRS